MGNCRNCKHWQPNSGQQLRSIGDAYACNHPKLRMIYHPDHEASRMTDGVAPLYSEGTPAGLALCVGPDFGCVHFESVPVTKEEDLFCKRLGIDPQKWIEGTVSIAELRQKYLDCGGVLAKKAEEIRKAAATPYQKLCELVENHIPYANIPKDQ